MKLHSRNKGKRFERHVANALKAMGIPARRGLTQSRGAIEPDVVIEGRPDIWVECKHHIRVDIRETLRQVARDTAAMSDPPAPLIFGRDTGGDVFVVIPAGQATPKTLAAFHVVGADLVRIVDYSSWRVRALQIPLRIGQKFLVVGRDVPAFYLLWLETLPQVWRWNAATPR